MGIEDFLLKIRANFRYMESVTCRSIATNYLWHSSYYKLAHA